MKFKRQNIFLTIVLIILISITLGISYAFLQTSFFASKESILKVGSLSLVLDEAKGNAITVSADGPLSDDEGVNLDNYYAFKLTNNGKVASQYTIYLDDQPLDDGDVRINQKYIHYSLEKDESNNIAKSLPGNQKLESGIINSKQTINYKLRLWFSSDMTIEEENKVFKAKLRIEGVSTSEESLNKKCQDAGGDFFIDGECRKYYVMKNNIAVVRQGSYAKLIANSDGSYTFSTDGLTYLANSIATTTTSMKSVGHNYYYNINILSMVEKLGHNSEKILEFAHKTVIDGIEYWPKTQFIYSLNATGMYTGIIVSNSEKDHFYIESYDWAEFTLMFGEGNEPSKEWCDKNLTSYIEYNESGVKTPISDINYTGKTSYYDVISMYK